MFIGGLFVPLLVAPHLCVEVGTEANEVVKAQLIGTITMVAGITTFLQSTFGSRYVSTSVTCSENVFLSTSVDTVEEFAG